MSERKHTPGPWMVEGRTVYALNEDGYNRFSALVQDAHTPGDELEANAQLIAAAPELLEALEQFVAWVDAPCESAFSDSQLASARAAIAKATGEQTE